LAVVGNLEALLRALLALGVAELPMDRLEKWAKQGDDAELYGDDGPARRRLPT
jgi:hypothetical protein